MLALHFSQKTALSLADVPEQWRGNISQMGLLAVGQTVKTWAITVNVQPEDSSYRYRALMQRPQLVLKFNLPFYIEFPVGTYCTYQNQRFMLMRAQDLKKQGTRKIEYSMTLGTNEEYFAMWKLRNVVDAVEQGANAPKDNRLKFSLCAKPHEFISLIVRNLNKKDTSVTWSVGECLESSEKTVEFNHSTIDAALTDIANIFNTEYEVEWIGTTQAKIHLRRVEYFKDSPVALSYGVGNGFIPGVGRTSAADGVPVKRMFVQGSDRNIDRAKYGSPELKLPISQSIQFDGTHFEDEDGFDSTKARTYTSDAEGEYVERTDVVSQATKEDSVDCSEIYPSRVGEVTSVVVANADKNFYDFIDNTIPEELNFNNCLIAGETMTVIFQDGMLAGKEFDVKYKHAERKFQIVPQEIDGVTMPNATWCPKEEQTYAIFGIQLPDSYICNNTDKSGGSWDMMRAAVKALYECEDQRFTFTGSLQSLWAKRHWLEVGGKLVVGGHVLFQDEQFAKYGVVIRIVGIKDFLTSPYSPTIELSNSVSGGSSVSSQIRQITNTEVVIDDTKRDILQFTKRRFRDAKETIEMLEDAQLDMFTNAISPIAVQAMSLLIGDESLQFQFVSKSGDNWLRRATPVSWDNEKKQLISTMTSGGLAIYLQHLTIGHNAITTKDRNDAQGYLTWSMESYTSPVLTDTSAKYYLYAKCPKDTNSKGVFVLSQTSIKLDEVANHYHFLVGLLNAEIDGERSFVAMHGFTEILPGRITTERIVSSDGNSFLDLIENSFKLGSSLDFNNEEKETLILNNAKIKEALKVLGEALIAGFYFSDERIRSTMMSGNQYALLLDGKTGHIKLVSTNTGGDYSLDISKSSVIDIDAQRGVVETRNDNGVAYLSASGIFCNNPKTNAMPSSSGYTHYGSIVGLGFGDNVSYEWEFEKETTLVAGVYGRADNSGNAPAYGGYFMDLCAAGLILKQKYITDSAATTAVNLGTTDTQAVGLTNKDKIGTVYLPTDGYEGKVIFAKQIGQGAMRFYPKSGQKIFDDITENNYYDVYEGQEAKFTFTVFNLNGKRVEAWSVSRWKF